MKLIEKQCPTVINPNINPNYVSDTIDIIKSYILYFSNYIPEDEPIKIQNYILDKYFYKCYE